MPEEHAAPMVDLHSHLLPGIDDGAADMEMSVAMARVAVEDGIRIIACTPHIVPGLYDNTSGQIHQRITVLRSKLEQLNIPLKLVHGADVHIAPDLPSKLGDSVPTLGDTRYFLLEPTHHVLPPRIVELAKSAMKRGFVPIITHPERLSWITNHYQVIIALNEAGCLMQITAGSLFGAFGRTSQRYAERMLDEGRVDLLASDAHNVDTRPPKLSSARELVARRYGPQLAKALVTDRPYAIITNRDVTPFAGEKAPSRIDEPSLDRIGLLGRLLRPRNRR